MCQYSTVYEENLTKHTKVNHMGEREKYPCGFCDHQATRKGHLLEHTKRRHLHDGQNKNIECNVCKKSVKTYSMKQHMKIFHSGPQLKFNCEHCEFQTIHKMNLNKHIMRKHERRPIEESRYDYDQIFKVFSTFEVETKCINVL